MHVGVDELLNDALDSDEPEEDEDLLAVINASLNPSDDTGAPVSEQLARLVNEKFTLDFYLQKRKSIMENYKTPNNCDQLFSPKVNPEIWGRLQSLVKRTDIKSCLVGYPAQCLLCYSRYNGSSVGEQREESFTKLQSTFVKFD